MRKLISVYLAVYLCIYLIFPSIIFAGEGRVIDGDPVKVDLIVNFLYDEQNVDEWKPLFTEASKLLYNATEKQMQIGKVTVYNNCPEAKDKADIWVLNDNSGARAHLLGLGANGKHLWVSQTHKSTSGAAKGQFGVVHELGHYAFNLGDEYIGTSMNKNQAPAGTPTKNPAQAFFCTLHNGGGKASIMDGGTKVSPNNTRTEFCTNPSHGFTTSHESGYINGNLYYINNQESMNHEASWVTISRIANSQYGVTLNQPSAEPADDISGHQAITWEVEDCRSRNVVCIDRSGSMGGDRIALAKTGGSLFVALADTGDDLGVTSFSSGTTVNFPLQEVMGIATKAAAWGSIAAISAGGSTSIGGGLRTSLNQILGGTRSKIESIVLLSDGYHNSGENPSSVIPDLIAAKVKVYTIGIGGADIALLQDIATQTGGRFFSATSAADLPSIFTTISAETASEGILGSASENVGAGAHYTKDILVDNLTSEASFVINWNSGDLDFTLKSPGGQIINPATVDPNVIYTDSSNYAVYKIKDPQSGTWQVIVDAGAQALSFTTQVMGESVGVEFSASASEDQYNYPDPVLVKASVIAGVPVAGAKVSAMVKRADGSSVGPIQLYDDGTHGDDVKNDGIYAMTFSQFAGDGVYIFNITVDNADGTAVAIPPDVTEQDPDNISPDIPPFNRESQLAVSVSGVPLLTIVTNTLKSGMLDEIYVDNLMADKGTEPYTWSIANGKLPPGLKLKSTSGKVTGDPVAPGIYNFTVRVQDALSATFDKDFSITVLSQGNIEGDVQEDTNKQVIEKDVSDNGLFGFGCSTIKGVNGGPPSPPSTGSIIVGLVILMTPLFLVKFGKKRKRAVLNLDKT
ncbi:MAG TPA: VWA domain-containing protein [Nitrospirota bacterium]|nr:VWA domain-containing protein [Nitrospirota bacterium]